MSFLRRHADAVLAAVLLAVTVVEVVLESQDDLASELAAAVVVTLPIAWRLRAPLTALLVSAAGMGTQFATEADTESIAEILSFLILLYTCGAHLELRGALWALAIGYAAVAPGFAVFEDVFFFSLFILPWWLAGRVLRDRRLRIAELERLTTELAHEREERERLAVEAERARIAREMHDILAHAMSLMTVQAGAGERLLDQDPKLAREAFSSIRKAGSAALGDLRRVLGRLRAPGAEPVVAPQPGLGNLDRLAEQVRAAGLQLDLELDIDSASVPPSVSLSAYRIIQEAATNTLKHAHARNVRIRVASADGVLTLSVEDDGLGAAANGGPGTRSGLIGMRERAAVHGGTLDAGPRHGGGYAVRARLPFATEAPEVASGDA